jgi:maltose/moltooligosaccharide transporter
MQSRTETGLPMRDEVTSASGWHVGTLTYSRGRLVNVFGWMLWGDLCLVISEAVVLRMVPYQMVSLHASNAAIGVVTGSILSLMNWIMNPIISTTSDRHRSPLGRRMPFMLYTAPFIALFLIGLGFSGAIGRWMHLHLPAIGTGIGYLAGHLLPGVGSLPPQARLTIAMLAIFMVLFRFFDLFPQCVYYYLFPDVIPQKLMGTFICLFSVTSAVGNIMFHAWLLPLAGTHPQIIFESSALLYLFTFLLLPLAVKEGEYPPPAPRQKGKVFSAISGWAKEAFSQGFYWKYFLSNSGYRWAFTPFNVFLVIYAQKKLNLGPADFGHVMEIVLIVQLPAMFLLGPVVDRFHPSRVAIVGFVMMILSGAAGFFGIHNKATFIGCTIAAFIATAVVKGSLSTLGPRVLPRNRYGQFCAATSMVSETGMLFLYYACGVLLDHLGQRYLFAWVLGFSVFGLMVTVSLYRSWITLGGDIAYTPPAVEAAL